MRLRLFALIAALLISMACSQAIRSPYLLVKSHDNRSEIRLPADWTLLPSTEYHKYKTDSQVLSAPDWIAYYSGDHQSAVFLYDSPGLWPTDDIDILTITDEAAQTRQEFVKRVKSHTIKHSSGPLYHYMFHQEKEHAKTTSVYLFRADSKLSSVTFHHGSMLNAPSRIERSVIQSLCHK